MIGSFSKEAMQLWDFVRCQRPNGTFYGTSGRCRSGTEVAPVSKKLRGSFLGAGKESKVYDIGRGRVLKVSQTGNEDLESHKIASQLGVAPKLFASGKLADGRSFQIVERVETSDIEGLPHPGTANEKGKEIEELDEEQLTREKGAYKASLQLNSAGINHGDLHGGNVKWDENNQKAILLDFDNATKNWKDAREEAASTLNSIGIRLENSGYYDEADGMYSLGARVAKSSESAFPKAVAKAIDRLEQDFPG